MDDHDSTPDMARVGMPAEMLDGIVERSRAAARPDDPAEIRARRDALRRQIHERDAFAAGTGTWAQDRNADDVGTDDEAGWSR